MKGGQHSRRETAPVVLVVNRTELGCRAVKGVREMVVVHAGWGPGEGRAVVPWAAQDLGGATGKTEARTFHSQASAGLVEPLLKSVLSR